MLDAPSDFGAAMTARVDDGLRQHLLRRDGQEDLCFAIYYPSRGKTRLTAILNAPILPERGDRKVHGNASFEAQYFERALSDARVNGGGLAFLHSHPFPGWQAMSRDDYRAEAGHAAAAMAATGLPLVGLTLGNDGAWSARFWFRVAPRQYEPRWCRQVRVAGAAWKATWHPELEADYRSNEATVRTASMWGEALQADLGRARIGIVGLGSVGSIVAESLARMGIRHLTFLDYDFIKVHNLDRTSGASRADAKARLHKVDVADRNTRAAATADGFASTVCKSSVVEEDGYLQALDCDILFSCVDRPWPRRVLNHIAYAHLIPVIDGGISVRHQDGRFKNANWSIRTAGPERACLECTGAYDAGLVNVEQQGHLDNPRYLQDLPADSPLRRRENVHPLSLSLAAHEVLQLVALVTGLVRMSDVGEQRYSYFPGIVEAQPVRCDANCPHQSLTGLGARGDLQVGSILGNDPGKGPEAQAGKSPPWDGRTSKVPP